MSDQEKTRSGIGGSDRGKNPQTPKQGGVPWKTVIIALIIIVGIGFLVSYRKKAAEEKGKVGAAKGANLPVPVVLGVVGKKDMPIYLDGLGTVQAFNTVNIRSRVDGQLEKLTITEGADVHAGDLLAQIDPASFQAAVEQAEAKKAQDEAQLQNAIIQLQRNEKLLAGHIASQEEYDTQKTLVNQLTATVKADQAAVDNARVQLNYTTIKAPIDGRAGIRQMDVGNIIRASDTNGIVTLTQLKPISVVFTLPEQSLRSIQKQLAQGELKVLAVDRDNSTPLDEGKLAVIDNQIDTTTGTIRIKATFPNEHLHLWPGQFVNTRLLLSVHPSASVVPASVVQRGPQGTYAFIVKDDMSVEMRTVKQGAIERDEALIEEGLQPGEKVVIDGQYKLRPGSKVKPAEAGKPGGGEGGRMSHSGDAKEEGTTNRSEKGGEHQRGKPKTGE